MAESKNRYFFETPALFFSACGTAMALVNYTNLFPNASTVRAEKLKVTFPAQIQ